MNHLANSHAHDTGHPIASIYELVARQRYGVEYQPIICTRSGDIQGFEALARFYAANGDAIPPLEVFGYLHMDLPVLRQVEQELKRLQIDYAPEGYDLFINIDPHSIELKEIASLPLIKQLRSRSNIIVELIENSDIHEARATAALHMVLKQNNIKTALDDIGASHSLLSLEVLSLVDYLKFDRSWNDKLAHQIYARMFRSILDFAAQTSKLSILEGIETKEMLSTANHYGINRVQGFLYRPLFQTVKP